jgi:peptidoglycan/xylan/chitin deacetylase (PgdA/CDA1 family)
LTTLWLEALYFTGCAWLAEWWRRDGGVILRFQRVRPGRPGAFQPLRSDQISPRAFARLLRALKRWNYDVLSIDQMVERLRQPPHRARRFVCVTFDVGYRDFLDHAWPVLKSSGVPVTLYLPSSFPDHLGELWWLALEQIVGRNDRIGLILDGVEQRLDCRSTEQKVEVFDFVLQALRTMSPAECLNTVRDLCARYGSNLDAISSTVLMNWSDIASIAGDPLLSIGSATVTYPMLSRVDRQTSERELRMGRAVVEAAVGRPTPHVAYPFGDRDSFGRREVILASDSGFATAVTAEPGAVAGSGVDLLALPRISWDGRTLSLRALRGLLAGFTLPRRRQEADAPSTAGAASTSR